MNYQERFSILLLIFALYMMYSKSSQAASLDTTETTTQFGFECNISEKDIIGTLNLVPEFRFKSEGFGVAVNVTVSGKNKSPIILEAILIKNTSFFVEYWSPPYSIGINRLTGKGIFYDLDTIIGRLSCNESEHDIPYKNV